MNCKHYTLEQRCSLAERLSRDDLIIKPTSRQCEECSQQYNPQDINKWTASLAIGGLWAKYGKDTQLIQIEVLKTFLRKVEPPNEHDWSKIGEGTGSWLKRIFEWLLIKPIENCDCVTVARDMNRNGTAWCKTYINELVAAIIHNFYSWLIYKFNKFVSYISKLKIIQWSLKFSIKTLVKFAIYLQQREERKNSNAETTSQIGSFTG